MNHAPSDNEALRFPVSIKGVVMRNGDVILLENERDGWDFLEEGANCEWSGG